MIYATMACLGVVIAGNSLTAYWLREATKYNRITRKLYAREPLTLRERRMLDKVR